MNALSPKTRGRRRVAATPNTSEAAPPAESALAVMTSWAFFAGFGFCFALSGLAGSELVVGLLGFATFITGFVAHLIINRIFGIGFTGPQVALALSAFTVAVLCFIAGAVFNPEFGAVDIVIGLAGFGALAATFVGYVLITYGIRGSYAMLHRLHGDGRRAP